MNSNLMRPRPPEHVLEDMGLQGVFAPAPELLSWARATFIDEGAPLYNPDHAHLADADMAMLWTSAPNSRNMKGIVGQCEMAKPSQGGKWLKARVEQQLREWFDHTPTFLLTFDALYAVDCDDASFCALVEHELYHASYELDETGEAPKFRKDGSYVYAIRGHDCEEFVGVVRRYGVGAAAGGVAALVEAARGRPEVALASVRQACGTCLARAA